MSPLLRFFGPLPEVLPTKWTMEFSRVDPQTGRESRRRRRVRKNKAWLAMERRWQRQFFGESKPPDQR